MRAHPCARLFSSDTLTSASLLPGVEAHYRSAARSLQCHDPLPDLNYVKRPPPRIARARGATSPNN
jgi:hypothetical protein